MRRHMTITIVFSFLSIMLCFTTVSAYAQKIAVAVSILPQKYFVQRIGGDNVDVQVMVPPGSEPHFYDPKPSQMVQLTNAELYFAIGVPFEKAWMPRFISANEHMRVIDLSANLSRIPITDDALHHGHESGEDGHEEHGEHEALDPHVWLSPANVTRMADAIRDALIQADPDHSAVYAAGHDSFLADITDLHMQLTEIFGQASEGNGHVSEHDAGRTFMVFHPSWGYFARDYQLRQLPIEQDGKEPSPRDLAMLIQHARELDIRVIFIQPQFAKRSAEAIARGIDGVVVAADPLAYDWLANMHAVAQAFRDALR